MAFLFNHPLSENQAVELTAHSNAANGKLYNAESGEVFVLSESNVVGRSRECTVPILDPRVSRRHAIIRNQDGGFWFFDLGSVNGSMINGRRVTASQLLSNGDVIQIADYCFRYENGGGTGGPDITATMADQTIADVRSRQVILLVCDIQGFSSISEKLTPDQLAPIIGSWYKNIESILANHGANIDKFIGDCVLGYWLDTSPDNRLAALQAAHAMQDVSQEAQREYEQLLTPLGLKFSSGVAVHIGSAAYGAFSSREFTLLGDAVNLVFRMESLTRSLNENVLVSAVMFDGWEDGLSFCRGLGAHSVKGREKPVEIYTLERDPKDSTP